MRKPSSSVIRVGDKIKIINDRTVARVGYPMSLYDAMDLVDSDSRFKKLTQVLLSKDSEQSEGFVLQPRKLPHYTEQKLKLTLAYQILHENGFGGRERKIIYNEPNEVGLRLKNHVTTVVAKKYAKTGVHFSACDGYDSYSGEYWYEPGGLADEKTHILLITEYGTFHADDVEKVMP